MKQLKNQQGYALLVVLLMVVLFLGISATFMAGSLSNAKQEQTIDASNQAVASAEMGVKYHSADFQREIGIIKSEIIKETQARIKSITTCFESGKTTCDTQEEITLMEKQIDVDMKAEYILKVTKKVEQLEALKGVPSTPFTGEDAEYSISGTSIIKQNESGQNVDLPSTTDKQIKSLKIQLDLSGESRGSTKYLKGIFTVQVPDTFLSATENITIVAKKVDDVDMSYEDVFSKNWPSQTCTDLIGVVNSGIVPVTKECLLGENQSAEEFVKFLKDNNLDPKDFKIYTNNFSGNICITSCNSINLEGITVVARPGDAGLFNSGSKNMNSMSSINLVIDGYFNPKNMNNLGEASFSQTIVVRELTLESNLMGSGLINTNILILGKEYPKDAIVKDSRMEFEKNLRIADNGRICFDLDRISPENLQTLSESATFTETENDTIGQIIYYTHNLDENRFYLSSKEKGSYVEDEERTLLYVKGYDEYTDFLSSCGIDVTNTTTEITDVPYPYILDPIFDLEVEY